MEPILSRAKDREVVSTAHGGEVLKEVIYAQESGFLPEGQITQIAVGRFPAGYTEDNTHAHRTMWQLDFVIEGEMTCVVEGVEYHLGPRDFLAIPPGMAHRQLTGKMPVITFYFGIAVS